MIGDVQQILRGNADKGDKDSPKIGSLTSLTTKKTSTPKTNVGAFKKPEGMARELYNLISNKELAAVMPTDMRKSYKNPKFQMGFRQVRKYKWVPFTNEARSDGLQLYHWQRIDKIDPSQPYPFARFNKVIDIPSYTDEEYDNLLSSSKWSRDETDYLFEICRKYDIRWPIVIDRYDKTKFNIPRSMEDLKDRFYAVVHEITTTRDPHAAHIAYDAEHERRRKEQLSKQYGRTREEVEEEESLTEELRRIEQRKKEREKKAHDLQKLINMSEQPASPSTSGINGNSSLKNRKSTFRIKTGSVSTTTPVHTNPVDLTVSSLRFSEFKSAGAHLRSQEMKLPTNIGQKKLKNIEVVLEKCKMDLNPVGSEAIMKIYNDFRSQVMMLQELKAAVTTVEFEVESLRTRAQEDGKDFEIEPRLRISTLVEGGLDEHLVGGEGNPTTRRRITSYIDATSTKENTTVAARKRKAPAVMTPTTSMELKRPRKM